MVLHTTLTGVLACCASAAVVSDYSNADDQYEMGESLSAVAGAEVAATLEAFANVALASNVPHTPGVTTPGVSETMHAASSQMDLKSAYNVIQHKQLPDDVSNLVQTIGRGAGDTAKAEGFAAEFSEESLAKARRALNELVEKAWIELDNKIFKCKGFEDMNREQYGQTTRDIMRLIEQINDLERIESESIDGISTKEQEITDTEGLLATEKRLYETDLAVNKADLTVRQNDLDVFQFILVFTKCPDATSLSQVKVCETVGGRKTFMFNDVATQKKYGKMLTAKSKKTIDSILRSIEGEHKKTSLLQQPQNISTPAPIIAETPVKGENGQECEVGSGGGASDCMKACNPDATPDCALLHDKLSLMWGEFKDAVDELTMTMMKNAADWEALKANLNGQIQLLVKAKARFQQLLAEARANLAADRAEIKEKYKQKGKLDRLYNAYMRKCKKRISWIMFQDMCAIKIVRNAVMENSTVCAAAEIQDCDMGQWTPASCSVSCDDSCTPDEPFKCGGWKEMTREPVVQPDECGIKCPEEVKYMRCGQYHCPIDCHMSEWSDWSKCTADCEGGLETHTRSIQTKPMNGGEPCNTVSESQACNTGSCDRNCKLAKWTPWTPCSVACGGGFQERFKHVVIPIRGEGRCPKARSRFRYGEQNCNTYDCNGDEVCIAVQDLVIAVDGSGSIRDSGFAKLKKFVETLLGRYQTEYYGDEAVKIGICLFGNGVIMPDGKTVSPAINAQPLTEDMAALKQAVADLPFKKGFTNMAQAFSMSEDMFTLGSRRGAQQSVMVITDGKPSFNFMTAELVDQLDDRGIMRYFIVINEEGETSDAMMLIRQWASQPWETNMIHVPGLTVLSADNELFAMKALTKFCPMAYSPSDGWEEAETYGFIKVKKNGWCGGEGQTLASGGGTTDQTCAALAVGAGCQSFLLGKFYRDGWCKCGTKEVDEELYTAWHNNPITPECDEEMPEGGTGWSSSEIYDFYAIEPTAAATTE